MRFAELDAVTVDAYGTLTELVDPVPALVTALAAKGIVRDPETVATGFAEEARYYRTHIHEGFDDTNLRALHERCAAVFLDAVGADVAPEEFAPAYVGSLQFRLLDGVLPALSSLRTRGVEMAVVGNWDVSLHERLRELGLASFFSVVVPVARKPDPARLLEALDALCVQPERALHVGDEPADEQAARAAGMRFAPAPLAAALAELT